MWPTSRGGAPTLMPRVEPLVGVPALSEPTASEPEEAVPPEELTLVPSQRPLAPPGFSLLWVDELGSPTPEQVDWPMSGPLEAQLDFASLGCLQVTILHFPVMGKICCEYQSWTISLTQASSPLALPKPQDQLDSSPWIKEL